jgi:uncharacterized protein (TIGR03437 family)
MNRERIMKRIALFSAFTFAAAAQITIDRVELAAGPPPAPSTPLCGTCTKSETLIVQNSLISIYGHNLATTTAVARTYPWPTELGGTTVAISGGPPCRLIYVSPNQINALVPANVGSAESNPYYEPDSPWGEHRISVTTPVAYGPFPGTLVVVGNLAPGLFTLADNVAAVRHADYQVVSPSHPAAPGESIALYATGLASSGISTKASTEISRPGPPWPWTESRPRSRTLARPPDTRAWIRSTLEFQQERAGGYRSP